MCMYLCVHICISYLISINKNVHGTLQIEIEKIKNVSNKIII